MCVFLVHDYILCFIGSPCYNVSYYNYNSIWPYYIVIHLTVLCLYDATFICSGDHGADTNFIFYCPVWCQWVLPLLCVYVKPNLNKKNIHT